MSFGEIAALAPGDTRPVTYEIDQHGADQRILCEFVGDNPPGSALVWWDIPISFRDTDESTGADVVRLCFDIQSGVLYSTAVPYTERDFKPPE